MAFAKRYVVPADTISNQFSTYTHEPSARHSKPGNTDPVHPNSGSTFTKPTSPFLDSHLAASAEPDKGTQTHQHSNHPTDITNTGCNTISLQFDDE
jgi:hypothetical protein